MLQEFKLENPTVGEREVGCSPVIREFEFVFLTVGNPCRNGRRERISTSEAMIYQYTSLGLGLMVEKDNVLRPYITHAPILLMCWLCSIVNSDDVANLYALILSLLIPSGAYISGNATHSCFLANEW
jgi:hypothetical protein